jgi:hypothetical protein
LNIAAADGEHARFKDLAGDDNRVEGVGRDKAGERLVLEGDP